MGIQSAVMAKQFGENFQYGKRRISAMSNEEFNATTPLDLLQQNTAELKAMIPTMQESVTNMRDFQTFLIREFLSTLNDAIKAGFGQLFGLNPDDTASIEHFLHGHPGGHGDTTTAELVPSPIGGTPITAEPTPEPAPAPTPVTGPEIEGPPTEPFVEVRVAFTNAYTTPYVIRGTYTQHMSRYIWLIQWITYLTQGNSLGDPRVAWMVKENAEYSYNHVDIVSSALATGLQDFGWKPNPGDPLPTSPTGGTLLL